MLEGSGGSGSVLVLLWCFIFQICTNSVFSVFFFYIPNFTDRFPASGLNPTNFNFLPVRGGAEGQGYIKDSKCLLYVSTYFVDKNWFPTIMLNNKALLVCALCEMHYMYIYGCGEDFLQNSKFLASYLSCTDYHAARFLISQGSNQRYSREKGWLGVVASE
jgi:hypothetical protein